MNYTRKDEIRKMLIFLDFHRVDHLFMQGLTFKDGSFPSCNGVGDFFINKFISRKPLPDPTDEVVDFAHAKLVWESKKQLNKLQLKYSNMAIFNLLKKYYHLEFISL